MTLQTLKLTADSAGRLALILGRNAQGGPIGDALQDLRHAATEAWTAGGELVVVTSTEPDRKPDTPRTRPDDDCDEVLSQQAAAEEAGVTERTIRRRLDDGTLPATVVNGRRRVRRGDLQHLQPSAGAISPAASARPDTRPGDEGTGPAGGNTHRPIQPVPIRPANERTT